MSVRVLDSPQPSDFQAVTAAEALAHETKIHHLDTTLTRLEETTVMFPGREQETRAYAALLRSERNELVDRVATLRAALDEQAAEEAARR